MSKPIIVVAGGTGYLRGKIINAIIDKGAGVWALVCFDKRPRKNKST